MSGVRCQVPGIRYQVTNRAEGELATEQEQNGDPFI